MIRPHHRAYLTAFLLDAAVMVVFATTPFFVFTQVGGDEVMAGVVGAIQMAAYALSCLISSRFVSQTRNGLRWALLGVGLFIFFSCLMPLYPRFIFCCVLSFLTFVALGLVWPALHSWIGAEPDAALRARHMASFNIAAGCGFALSPLLGGPLYDLDYRLPFVALACLGAMIAALIRSLPHEKEHFHAADPEQDSDDTFRKRDTGNRTNLLAAWCAVFVANVLVGATRSVYPKRVMDLLDSGELRFLVESSRISLLSHAPATTFSWLVSTLWIATALCFFIMGRRRRGRHQTRLLLWLQVMAGGAMCVLGYTQSLSMMIVCFATIGVNFGVSFFVAMSFSLANPVHKHRRAAITEGVLGAGCFVGSIAFGYVAGGFGVTAPFLYTPVFAGLGVVLQLWLLRRGRRQNENSAATGQACREF
jgi:MFS family permease